MQILTVSSAKRYRRCMREYYLGCELCLRPARAAAAPLRFGTAVHAGLEALLSGDPHAIFNGTAELDPVDRARAEVLLQGYELRWQDDGLTVLAVEAQFVAPLRNPDTGAVSRTWQLAGKIDAVVKDDAGRVWIVEHKTTSLDLADGASLYWERLRMDPQISTYFVGARSLGHDPAGCIYDVIRKPTIRPYAATPDESRKYRKDGALYASQREQDEPILDYLDRLITDVAGNPDKYYRRGVVVRIGDEETDAAADMWTIGRMIRESQLSGRWPRNPEACERWGRMCSYWPICSGECDADDRIRFTVGEPHEELEL